MTFRKLTFARKKLRGIPRLLRTVQQWPEEVARCDLSDVWDSSELYWNWKIPVHMGLVDGKYATPATRRVCAQVLLDAMGALLARKPADRSSARVTCTIDLSFMFGSELCVYLDEDYFGSHVDEGRDNFGGQTLVRGRKLSTEWGLRLPPGMSELGLVRKELDDDGYSYFAEHWYFGEVVR